MSRHTKLCINFGVSDRASTSEAIQEIIEGQRYIERSACKDDVEFMINEYEGEELKAKVVEYFEDVDR